ncbi:TPA: metallophosphoesterase family protein [Pseudomonas aeruginosa]|uniref:Phosphoesterase n=1 Tax=Pseudomonas kuykendallii TaxID=1007099 RepID=A0A2W5CUX5_9PSED|nr:MULTISPECIES: metallophosphoesterase family protein [Pseudomonas]AVE33414.1 metallophosphoesterase [Pseudomonas aeruginosa]EIU3467256.1 metallophosphoesterase family protein [Pseudomonas aeruginosa]EKX6391792.1 metallophosphoesterase family protein [Pseudomonas aeruginosa]KSK95629.1 YfcE family phosphodiesterase [Pseudomonas aeruginosa]MBG4927359.1 metallophosphoesterase family protein [Pseudomonas aeruginosa]
MKIGLISDTHGLLRDEALEALKQCDHLIHAGDIGAPGVLVELERIAPLSAIRGNNDEDQEWAADIPERLLIRFGRVCVYVLHDLKALDLDPVAEGIDVVVSGHSHVPRQELRDGVLYVNPGSAGRRRFKLPVAVGFLQIDGSAVSAELKTLLP